MIDTTPASATLEGLISPNDWFLIQNPAGMQNNDGRIELYNESGDLTDAISYGNWNDGDKTDNAPDGDSTGLSDESLSRYPDGADNIIKTLATPGRANVPEPATFGLVSLSALALRRRKH
ncbi:PEP-CTERM sorting domain-containing protein [Candidatus Pacearchaeota archaeon]|nr:PEP-CTERM sorting domain-containing protein [Candidatus Pacearchaeota archaeon]